MIVVEMPVRIISFWVFLACGSVAFAELPPEQPDPSIQSELKDAELKDVELEDAELEDIADKDLEFAKERKWSLVVHPYIFAQTITREARWYQSGYGLVLERLSDEYIWRFGYDRYENFNLARQKSCPILPFAPSDAPCLSALPDLTQSFYFEAGKQEVLPQFYWRYVAGIGYNFVTPSRLGSGVAVRLGTGLGYRKKNYGFGLDIFSSASTLSVTWGANLSLLLFY